MNQTEKNRIHECLKYLKLPTIREIFEEESERARSEVLGYETFLLELLEREKERRSFNRVEKQLKESGLDLDKSLENFEMKQIGIKQQLQMKTLLQGDFLRRKENILAFGTPGSGKTHFLSAIAIKQIQQGKKIKFYSTQILVQELLFAKKEYKLKQFLKKLGKNDAILIDDIGYVQQSREEMEVLFTLLSHCYERLSLMISSNLPFSNWEQIFKDPLTTAAAIDRLVHHCMIIELNNNSYRMAKAKQRQKQEEEKSQGVPPEQDLPDGRIS